MEKYGIQQWDIRAISYSKLLLSSF
jgi:hypothetical protein